MPSPRMAVVYEKLYQAVCNQNMNRVLTATYEIFGTAAQEPVSA